MAVKTFYRLADLIERGIVPNATTLQRWKRDCGFPAGYALGPHTVAYAEDEISAWLSSRPRRGFSMPPPGSTQDDLHDDELMQPLPGRPAIPLSQMSTTDQARATTLRTKLAAHAAKLRTSRPTLKTAKAQKPASVAREPVRG